MTYNTYSIKFSILVILHVSVFVLFLEINLNYIKLNFCQRFNHAFTIKDEEISVQNPYFRLHLHVLTVYMGHTTIGGQMIYGLAVSVMIRRFVYYI